MSHVRFAVVLVLALCAALPLSIVFAMNECQFHPEPTAVEQCFRNAERGARIYWGTISAALILAVGLHIARSKWTPLALAALAVGPWLTMLA